MLCNPKPLAVAKVRGPYPRAAAESVHVLTIRAFSSLVSAIWDFPLFFFQTWVGIKNFVVIFPLFLGVGSRMVSNLSKSAFMLELTM